MNVEAYNRMRRDANDERDKKIKKEKGMRKSWIHAFLRNFASCKSAKA